MKWREQDWLVERLKAWVQAGLLQPGQADAIGVFEAEHRRRRILDPALLTGVFAALCVVLGAILIVSHNWDSIPDWLKQSSFLLLTIAFYLLRGRMRPGPAAQAADSGLVLWPLAGIGLWAQVYQLSGDPSRPLLTAAVLALPLVWWGRSPWAAALQAVLAVLGLFMAVHGHQGFAYHALATELHWEMQLLLWSWLLLLFIGRQRLPERLRSLLLAAFLAWLYSLVMLHGFRLRHQSCYYMAAGGSLLLYWGTARFMRVGEARAEADGAFWYGFLLYVASFGWWGHDWQHGVPVCAELLAFPFVVSSLGVLSVLAAPLRWADQGWGGRWVLKGLLIAGLLPGLILAATFDQQGPDLARLIINLLLGVSALYWMLSGVARSEVPAVNRGVGWMALLLVTRFIDVASSLLNSGLGFILGGLALALLAWALQRARKRLLAAAGEGA